MSFVRYTHKKPQNDGRQFSIRSDLHWLSSHANHHHDSSSGFTTNVTDNYKCNQILTNANTTWQKSEKCLQIGTMFPKLSVMLANHVNFSSFANCIVQQAQRVQLHISSTETDICTMLNMTVLQNSKRHHIRADKVYVKFQMYRLKPCHGDGCAFLTNRYILLRAIMVRSSCSLWACSVLFLFLRTI